VIARRSGAARVWFTDRHGGASTGPYESANLADHVGDTRDAVAANRRRLARTIDGVLADPQSWVWLRQVHGATVCVLDVAPSSPPEADAAVTTAPALPLVVLVADCAPVALVAPGAVAVAHAGWAGLELGVLERAVETVRREGGDPVRAVLGPCIHPARYEFGADLLERLVARLGPEVAARTAEGTPALDIPAAVRAALACAGVDDVDDVDVCTAGSADHFSARRDGVTGRQAVVVVRDA
jgi:YfiH family protein